jgi:hypothetical protein
MMNALLHTKPVAVDRAQHRDAHVRVPVTDWSVASKLNSIVITGAEFGPACRDFPVVFVPAGNDEAGKPLIAPIAVLGLGAQENLYVDDAGHWRATYMPALMRAYPFGISRIDPQRFAVCLDTAYPGVSMTGGEGERLFNADGGPTDYMTKVQKMLEQIETEIQRTRAFCSRLQALDLLREVRMDATMPGGEKLAVNGFLTIDEKKFRELPDDVVLELHRNGILGLIHGHFLSMGHMARLLDWHSKRTGAATTVSNAAAAATAATH